jgi:hypothetical protein
LDNGTTGTVDADILVAMFCIGVGWPGSTVADAATLVRDGKPAAVIVTAATPTPLGFVHKQLPNKKRHRHNIQKCTFAAKRGLIF